MTVAGPTVQIGGGKLRAVNAPRGHGLARTLRRCRRSSPKTARFRVPPGIPWRVGASSLAEPDRTAPCDFAIGLGHPQVVIAGSWERCHVLVLN